MVDWPVSMGGLVGEIEGVPSVAATMLEVAKRIIKVKITGNTLRI
jgi:hypothetical protein